MRCVRRAHGRRQPLRTDRPGPFALLFFNTRVHKEWPLLRVRSSVGFRARMSALVAHIIMACIVMAYIGTSMSYTVMSAVGFHACGQGYGSVSDNKVGRCGIRHATCHQSCSGGRGGAPSRGCCCWRQVPRITCLSTGLNTCLNTCINTCLNTCLNTYLNTCLNTYLSACRSVCPYTSLCCWTRALRHAEHIFTRARARAHPQTSARAHAHTVKCTPNECLSPVVAATS